MLPQANENAVPKPHTIFINPNFPGRVTQQKNSPTNTENLHGRGVATHVNPLFLQSRQQSAQQMHVNPQFIHMNPVFYQKKLMEHQQQHQQLQLLHQQQQRQCIQGQTSTVQKQQQQQQQLQQLANTPFALKKTLINPNFTTSMVTAHSTTTTTTTAAAAPLLHLSRRKLIRSSTATTTANTAPTTVTVKQIADVITPIRELHPVVPTKANTKLNAPSRQFRYKLDRRKLPLPVPVTTTPTLKSKPAIRTQYVLKKKLKLILRLPAALKAKQRQASPAKTPTISSQNRKLTLVNINNIVYKSTQNKLQRNDAAANRALLLRYKTPASATHQKKTLSTLQTRSYLNNVKQRSVQQLKRCYAKTNEPCAVYQRLGKCAAHERGRCMKKHDKQQVIICPKLLRGECFNSNCLLSHNVSLAKMPVCKFYLQGLCVRSNCPYLHKKLNEKAEVCTEFLRGFCRLAEKCEKRHEFLCPELAKHKKCLLANCLYCRQAKQPNKLVKRNQPAAVSKAIVKEQQAATETEKGQPEETQAMTMRYFADANEKGEDAVMAKQTLENEHSDSDAEQVREEEEESPSSSSSLATVGSVYRQKRPKIGTLPAYIPLSS